MNADLASWCRCYPSPQGDCSLPICFLVFRVVADYTPANQWNPISELIPPVPLPKPATESTT